MTPIIEEDFYVFVAPDGQPQITLLAEDRILCEAVANTFHQFGVGMSANEMKAKGFTIEKVKLTVVSQHAPTIN